MNGSPSVPENLFHKTIRGGSWIFTLRVISQVLIFARLIILARLLVPADFGLMGVALLTIEILDTFSQPGFENALIQRKGITKGYLNSAWTVLIARGLLLFVIVFLTAPLMARFFSEPDATAIIRVTGCALLIQAMTNIGVVYFDKEMEFHKQFLYEFSGTLANFIIAVVLAYLLRSVWALVFGLLAKRLTAVLASYLISSYRPRLDLNLDRARELWSFGKWILGSRILLFLTTEGDDIVVGRLLGAVTLGFYQMAFKIANMPVTEVAHTINRVTFPAYSKIQDDLPKLRSAFLKTLTFTAFLSVPLTGLIIILASDFTWIFLGEEWMPIVPAMQVIAITGMLRSVAASTNAVFQAVNRPSIDTKWGLARLIVMAVLILPFTINGGMVGTALAVLAGMLVATVAFCINVINITDCGIHTFNKALILPLICGAIMLGSIAVLKMAMNSVGFWQFSLLAVVGVCVYLAAIYVGDGLLHTGLRRTIENALAFLVRSIQPKLLAEK